MRETGEVGGGERVGFFGGRGRHPTRPRSLRCEFHILLCAGKVCVCVCVFARAREHGLVCVHAHICLYSYVSAKSELYVWLPSL
jgi:hypothetical protein